MTLDDLQRQFESSELTCSKLVETQLDYIYTLNGRIQAVTDLDPTAMHQADTLDWERLNGSIRG